MFRLALLTLRGRTGSFVASFLALFFGASIVLACGGLLETAIRLDTPPARLAATPIVVTGDQFYPEPVPITKEDAAAVAATPGVQDVAAETSTTGDESSRQRTINLNVSLNESANVEQVASVIKQKLKGHKLAVLTGSARGQAEFVDAKPSQETLIVLAAVFGGMAIMVAVLIVASTISLSLQQRMREMALLRAIGALPAQLRRMVMGETLVLALLAGLLAPLVGAPLGHWILDQLAAADVVSSHIAFHLGWVPMAAAAVIVLLTALGSALLAAKAVTKVRPVEALEQVIQPHRWASVTRLLLAGLFLAGGVVVAALTAGALHGPVAASTVGATATLWAVGFALIAPAIARGLTGVLSSIARLFTGVAGYLSALNLRARTQRVANILIPIMLTTGLATALLYMQTTLAASAQQVFVKSLRADAILMSKDDGLPLDIVDKVREVPGVGAASALVNSSVFFANDGGTLSEDADKEVTPLQGVTARDASATTAFDVRQGSLEALNGNTVALTTDKANGLHKRLGDSLTLQLGDGTLVRPKIAALLHASPGYETVLMPADAVTPHTRSGLAQQVLIAKESGVSEQQLLTALQAFAATQPGVQVANQDQLKTLFNKGEQTGVWINYLLAGMIIGYTVIALVNSLIIAVMERRREFALQRLAGSTKGQIMAMMSVEGVVIAVAGAIFGTFVAGLILAPFGMGLWNSPRPEGPMWMYLVIIGFTSLLTIGTTLLVTGVALRGSAVERAGNRE
jgi:putative ABC transport system permease protein